MKGLHGWILKTWVLYKEICVQSLWETVKCRDKEKNKRLHKDVFFENVWTFLRIWEIFLVWRDFEEFLRFCSFWKILRIFEFWQDFQVFYILFLYCTLSMKMCTVCFEIIIINIIITYPLMSRQQTGPTPCRYPNIPGMVDTIRNGRSTKETF